MVMSRVLERIRWLVDGRPTGTSGDADLLERFAREGDEQAFATLFRRHAPMVLGVCQRVLRDAADAEDTCQATFLVLARKAGSIRSHASAAGWLYQVAYRVALRARAAAAQRRNQERRTVDMVAANDASEVERRELRALLDEELQNLPEKYRTPLILCHLQGKSAREAARELGWPEGSMPKRLSRAEELLRGRLLKRGLTLSAAGFAAQLRASTAPAAVPPTLLGPTIKAALLQFAGDAAAGEISALTVLLAEGVLHSMWLTKIKLATAAVLVLALLVGSGVLAHRAMADRPADAAQRPAPLDDKQSALVSAGPEKNTIRVDYRNGTKQDARVNAVAIESPILAIAVMDMDGKVIPTVPPPFPRPGVDAVVAAGKTRSFTYTLNHFSPALKPGKYKVKVRLDGWPSNVLEYTLTAREARRELGTVQVGEYTGTVVWQQDDDGKQYRVDVFIPKPLDKPAIKGERFSAWVLADKNRATALKQRSTGDVPEERGRTALADVRFLFQADLPRESLIGVVIAVDGKLSAFSLPTALAAGITKEQAIAVASAEAKKTLGDLTDYRIKAEQIAEGWRVDVELVNPMKIGGNVHYLLDVQTGKILATKTSQ